MKRPNDKTCVTEASENTKSEKTGKPFFKGKGKHGSSRPGSRQQRGATKFNNDPEYYRHNPELIEASAKLPFSLPAGNSLNLTYRRANLAANASGSVSQNTMKEVRSIPGIMVARMLPTIGTVYGMNGTAPIDVAAKDVYTWVRHANSGSANYDSPDLMLYLLAMREVYSFAGYLIRLYSAMLYVDPYNRYTQRVLVEALGGDYDDLKVHLPDFLYYINFFFTRVDALAVPSLPMFKKAFTMFSKVFADDKTGKGQLYAYTPADFLIFDETVATKGGCLVSWGERNSIPNPLNMMKLSDLTALGEDLLQPLLDSEDIGIMSGDIRKAYSSLFTLGTMPGDAHLIIEHDAFDLQVMHNITRFPVTYARSVFQDTNGRLQQYYTIYNPNTSGSNVNCDAMYTADEALIDIDSQVPSTDEIVESVLYKSHARVLDQNWNDPDMTAYATECSTLSLMGPVSGRSLVLLDTGTDYFCAFCVYWQYTHGPLTSYIGMDDRRTDDALILSTNAFFLSSSAFDWAPFYAATYYSGGENAYATPVGSYHNYTVVSWEVIRRLHNTIWMSLLGVPTK